MKRKMLRTERNLKNQNLKNNIEYLKTKSG